jgi:hypothetical protein
MIRQLMNNNSSNTTRHTPVTSTKKRKHDAKTPSSNPEEKEMPLPDHRQQRQQHELEIVDPPSTTIPLAIAFGGYTENIDIDTGGNENNAASSVISMCTAETPTVVEEEISITGHGFTNNDMDYTDSPIPTTITATTQSNGEFTPVLNGSSNRQSRLERRDTTTTTTNNCYSALQTTSTTKESNNNNTNDPSAKDRHDRKND